mmetsp:Transcript_354/g.648  ORF Transcript_354/g.648 Transcript_354/m.648 type:complete len:354 (-) Transcript_354:193-1254(-)
MERLRRFRQQLFALYESRPLLMNTIAGCTVYVAGEVTTKIQDKGWRALDRDDWMQISKIGVLGSVENGAVMLTWYKVLNNYIGSSGNTAVVLSKCLLDQIFFATQQDFLFLALCAYNEVGSLSQALTEIKDTFLTTWIMDCSLWPFINFFGFAFLPYTLQPTYMACMSYFWQLYISGVASKERSGEDSRLMSLFREIDLDNNQYLDAKELQHAFASRGIAISLEDIDQMISDADASTSITDGKVSFEEFKNMLSSSNATQSSQLWGSIRDQVPLTKGAKSAMKRLQDWLSKTSDEDSTTLSADSVNGNILISTTPHPSVSSLDENRNLAIRNAKLGMIALGVVAIIRVAVFRV